MRRSGFTVMLLALLLSTQTLLAACGLRCDVRMTGTHTHARRQVQMQGSPGAMGGCHEGMVTHSRDRSGAVWEHPCCSQHCGQNELQVFRTSADRLDLSLVKARVSAASLSIEGGPLLIAPAQETRSHLRSLQAILDPLSLPVLNIRV